MLYDDFKDSPSGTLKPTLENQWAFVPNPLPPTIDFSAIMGHLQDAAIAIGHLNGSGKQIDNPNLVIRPLLRKEALLSSSMEGTFTTANALVMAEADTNNTDSNSQEVLNYILAFQHANKILEEIPISNRMIKSTHNILLSNLGKTRSSGRQPGTYKTQQNYIGGTTRKIADARFVPPPPEETEQAMGELEKYINREDAGQIPPLIDAALIHYQFETIHPFSDGNGRMGRILIPLFLKQKGILEKSLLFVSPVVEGRKEEYVDAMLDVSKTGNWTGWIQYFLEVITASCNSTISTIDELLELRNYFRLETAQHGGSAKLTILTDELFTHPIISIPQAAEIMELTYPSAQNAVNKLVELDILHEIPATNHPRLFICTRVVNATNPF